MSTETAARELTAGQERRPEPGPARRRFDLSARILASDAKPPVDEATPVEVAPIEPPRRAVEAGARLNSLQPLAVDPTPVLIGGGVESRPLRVFTYGATLLRPETGLQLTGSLRNGVFSGIPDVDVPLRALRVHVDFEGRGGISAQHDFGGEPEAQVIACTPIAPSPRFSGESMAVFSHLVVVRPHPTDIRVLVLPEGSPTPIAVDGQDRPLQLDIDPGPNISLNGGAISGTNDTYFASYADRSAWLGSRVRTGSTIFSAGRSAQMPACVFPTDPPAVFLVYPTTARVLRLR